MGVNVLSYKLFWLLLLFLFLLRSAFRSFNPLKKMMNCGKLLFIFGMYWISSITADCRKCSSNFFQCVKSNFCIPKRYLCDGYEDCSDGSDEEITKCGLNICDNSIKCFDGRCIPKEKCCLPSIDPNCSVGYILPCCKLYLYEKHILLHPKFNSTKHQTKLGDNDKEISSNYLSIMMVSVAMSIVFIFCILYCYANNVNPMYLVFVRNPCHRFSQKRSARNVIEISNQHLLDHFESSFLETMHDQNSANVIQSLHMTENCESKDLPCSETLSDTSSPCAFIEAIKTDRPITR